jgi:hypothetical protein
LRVGRALALAEGLHDHFRVLPALDHFDDASGFIGANVVADEGVTRSGIVAAQRGSLVERDLDRANSAGYPSGVCRTDTPAISRVGA